MHLQTTRQRSVLVLVALRRHVTNWLRRSRLPNQTAMPWSTQATRWEKFGLREPRTMHAGQKVVCKQVCPNKHVCQWARNRLHLIWAGWCGGRVECGPADLNLRKMKDECRGTSTSQMLKPSPALLLASSSPRGQVCVPDFFQRDGASAVRLQREQNNQGRFAERNLAWNSAGNGFFNTLSGCLDLIIKLDSVKQVFRGFLGKLI
jgi:hypothetical protein